MLPLYEALSSDKYAYAEGSGRAGAEVAAPFGLCDVIFKLIDRSRHKLRPRNHKALPSDCKAPHASGPRNDF